MTVYYTQQKVCDFHVLVTAAQLGIERVGDKDVHVEVLDRTILIRATSSGAAHVKVNCPQTHLD